MNAALVHKHRLAPITADEARRNGFECLSPFQKAVAIEFATTGATLKEVAQRLGHPLADVRAAFGDPLTRALIHDLQMEIAQHKVVNAAWVEAQVMRVWPQFIGEEDVAIVTKDGDEILRKKFHAPEVAGILKHFSGNKDQAAIAGVQVNINFAEMGVGAPKPAIDISGGPVG